MHREIVLDGLPGIYIMRTSSAAAGVSGGWGRGGREKKLSESA
jgi:hypothetical protein